MGDFGSTKAQEDKQLRSNWTVLHQNLGLSEQGLLIVWLNLQHLREREAREDSEQSDQSHLSDTGQGGVPGCQLHLSHGHVVEGLDALLEHLLQVFRK